MAGPPQTVARRPTAPAPRPRTGARRQRRSRPALLSSATARSLGLAAALLALLAAAAASIAVGSLQIPVTEVLEAFTDPQPTDEHVIVRELRGPRTLVAIAVGLALGVAGAIMQGLTRNPLADPAILGLEAGAALFVVLAIFLLGVGSTAGYAWFALAGAAVAGVLVYGIGTTGRSRATPVNLALAGAAVTALCVALTSAVIVVDARTLDEYRFWVVGSFAGRDLEVLAGALPFIVAGLALALASGRALNALALGEDLARALGQRVALARGGAAAASVLLAGGAVAVAGPVGFVGLTVPHVARALVGPDYRWLLPYAAVLGSTLVLCADVLGRIVARPSELQVGIVMAVIGAPVFIAIVRRRRIAEL